MNSEMYSTEGSPEAPPLSDSSLDTMLSAAVVAREQTSDEHSSSDVSDSVRQGLAGDFTDSSESDFVGQLLEAPQRSGPSSGPGQARIWGSAEELRLARGGAVPPAEGRGSVNVPTSSAAVTGGAAAQTGPPRPHGRQVPRYSRRLDRPRSRWPRFFNNSSNSNSKHNVSRCCGCSSRCYSCNEP